MTRCEVCRGAKRIVLLQTPTARSSGPCLACRGTGFVDSLRDLEPAFLQHILERVPSHGEYASREIALSPSLYTPPTGAIRQHRGRRAV